MRALFPLAAALLAAVALALTTAAADARTVWLCKPGQRENPCRTDLDTARFSPTGQPLGTSTPRLRRPRIDCFYVYPTVSDQDTPTATKARDPEIRSIARFQAARYSSTCRVFAPVYRQVTLAGIGTATERDWERAYGDVRAAWRAYLRRHNHGRGVVLIGHSQGTFHLADLIAREIEPRRRQRSRIVSALLLGGNVTVGRGRDTGGSFRRLRACRRAGQIRCVVAFSTFLGPLPADAAFGRAPDPAEQVLCTNPAALAGGDAALDPMLPRAPFAPGTGIAQLLALVGFPVPASDATWLRFPGAYTGRCVEENGVSALQIAPAAGAPALNPVPPSWGLHLADANIALGDLERLVRRQAAAYLVRR
jgi:hypothetical protein